MTGDASAPSEVRGVPGARRERGFTVRGYAVTTLCLKPNERETKLEPREVVNS